MDPLSITAAVLSLTATSVKVARGLVYIRGKYKHAQLTISAISTEATVVSASLSRIQGLILRDAGGITGKLEEGSDLTNIFDCALTGCSVVLEVIDDEIQKLVEASNGEVELGWTARCRLIWNEQFMQDLLNQLRGQQTALTLLLQGIQLESMNEMNNLMQANAAVLQRVNAKTRSLREDHPGVNCRRSIFESDDIVSIYSGAASTAGATEFDFDNFLFKSKVYRRAFAGPARPSRPRQMSDDQRTATHHDEDGDNATIHADDSNTIIDSVFEDPMPLPDAKDSANAELMVAALDKDRWSSVEIYNLVQAHENLKGELEEARKEYAEKLQELSASRDATAPAQAQVDELSATLNTLNTKYRKVKTYYFEKVAREEALVAEVAGHVKQAETLAGQIEAQAMREEYLESVKSQCMDVEKQYSLKCQELENVRASISPGGHEQRELREKYHKVKRYYFDQRDKISDDAERKRCLAAVIVNLTGTTPEEVERLSNLKPIEGTYNYADNWSDFLDKHALKMQHLRHLTPDAPPVEDCTTCVAKRSGPSDVPQPDRRSLAASDSSMTLNGEDYRWDWGTGAWRKTNRYQSDVNLSVAAATAAPRSTTTPVHSPSMKPKRTSQSSAGSPPPHGHDQESNFAEVLRPDHDEVSLEERARKRRTVHGWFPSPKQQTYAIEPSC